MLDIKKLRTVAYLEALRKLYSKKNKHYRRTGKRLLSLPQVEERFDICKKCTHFNGQRCLLCECCVDTHAESHLNKLAFPTEQCPADPPKWGTVE